MTRVILKPWKKPKDSQLRDSLICELPNPDNKDAKRLPVNEVSNENDSRSKKICVIVTPKVAGFLIEGMVLGGIFVKIVQNSEEYGQRTKEWWYMEKLIQTLPSYYKEIHAGFIDNLVQFTQ